MSRVQANLDITAVIKQIVTAHTLYPLAVEQKNRSTVDQVSQVKPYLKVQIKMLSSRQLDLGDRPWVEQWGQIWLTAICKPGEGTVEAETLLDFITPYFELKKIGIVQCRSVTAVDGKEIKGLWHEPAIVNFYYHRRT